MIVHLDEVGAHVTSRNVRFGLYLPNITVLELMPVSNVKEDVEWGYTPLGYSRRTIGTAVRWG